MTQIIINTTPANSGQGDSPKAAFDKINANFTDIYTGTYGNSYPAATSLTGAELAIITSSGVVETATTAQIAALGGGTPATVLAGPTPVTGITNPFYQQNWHMFVLNGQSAIFPPNAGQITGTQPLDWTSTGSISSINGDTPSASTLWGAMQQVRFTSAAAINSNAAINQSSAGNSYNPSYRQISAGPGAGFTLIWTGSFNTAKSDKTVFVGMSATFTQLAANIVPSALLNSIGFSKDTGDATLQFMANNGSGSATKTNTGITMASIQGHLVRISISCDPSGNNVTATFQDLETGGTTVSYTVPNAQAKNIVVNTPVYPYVYVGTGPTTATAVALGVSSVFAAYSLIQ